jgi:predicted HAD superfamily phosphohydrolase YqeG
MLKPLSQNQKNLKTLFIDLDETLIYNNTKDPKGMELKINVDNSEV